MKTNRQDLSQLFPKSNIKTQQDESLRASKIPFESNMTEIQAEFPYSLTRKKKRRRRRGSKIQESPSREQAGSQSERGLGMQLKSGAHKRSKFCYLISLVVFTSLLCDISKSTAFEFAGE